MEGFFGAGLQGEMRRLQDAETEQGSEQYLLLLGHLQSPEENGGQAAGDEVLEDGDGVGGDGVGGFVEALVGVLLDPDDVELAPVGLEGVAGEEEDDGEDEQIGGDEDDVGLDDADELGGVDPAREAAVEEENADLGEARAGGVELFDDENHLDGVSLACPLIFCYVCYLSRLQCHWLCDVPNMTVISVANEAFQVGVSIIQISVLGNGCDEPRIITASTPAASNCETLA